MKDVIIVWAFIAWIMLGAWYMCSSWYKTFHNLTLAELIINVLLGAMIGLPICILSWIGNWRIWKITIFK